MLTTSRTLFDTWYANFSALLSTRRVAAFSIAIICTRRAIFAAFFFTNMIAWSYSVANLFTVSMEKLSKTITAFVLTSMSTFKNSITEMIAAILFEVLLFWQSTINFLPMTTRKFFVNFFFTCAHISFFLITIIEFIAINFAFFSALMTTGKFSFTFLFAFNLNFQK